MMKFPRVWCHVLVSTAVLTASPAGSRALGAQQTVAAGHNSVDDTRANSELLSRRVTITLTNVSRAQALTRIAHAAQVFLAYHAKMLDAYPGMVSVHAASLPLGTVLEQVLAGTGLRVVSDNQGGLIVTTADDIVSGDSVPAVGTITGRVVDSATGHGLVGVTIKVAGTKIAGLTQDSSGRFVLHDVPAGSQLITAKAFGYRPREHTVAIVAGQQLPVRFILVSVPNVLSGVVTTATGVQRKIEVGNDITTLNADSLMKVAPITSVTDMLENRVPGLTVMHSSGVPGDPSRIRLRGAGSITGNNDPIVIVDGVRVYASQSDARNMSLARSGMNNVSPYATPSPLDQIDPSSIETIEVFKGPSASAMYGVDAANGVIVITTKRGQAGPTHWDLNLGVGFHYMPGDWPVNYYRFGYGPSSVTGSPFCAWNDLGCTVDSVVAYQALNDPRYDIFADHGSDQSGALTVSGGSPTLRYSLTASAQGNLGIVQMPGIEQQRFIQQYGNAMPQWMIRPDKYNTLGGSGQLTASPSRSLSVTWMNSLYNSTQQRSSLEQATSQLAGEYIDPLLLGAGSLLTGEYERATNTSLTLTSALTANWAPVSWLPLYATGGVNTGQRVNKTYVPYGIYFLQNSSYDSTGSFGYGRGTTFDRTLTIRTMIPMPRLTLGIGGSYHDASTDDFSAYTNHLVPGVAEPSAFLSDVAIASQFQRNSSDAATYGWFVAPTLDFQSRFFVAPGFQLSGGSAQGTHGGFSGTGLTGFPKISLSYVLVDRQTDPLWGVVSLLRPRLALGVAGTQPGPADKLRLFSSSTGANGALVSSTTAATTALDFTGAVVPATFLSAMGNTTLQPERSGEFEGGFDADLWNNRLSLTYSRYDKVRHNAILSVPIAASVSATTSGTNLSYNVNIGEIRSTGTEVTATAQVLENRAIGWNVGLSYSHSNEILVHLNPGQHSMTVGSGTGAITRLVPGYPLWGRWALPILAYADANQDSVIERDEIIYGDSLVYLGPQQPKHTIGMYTDLNLFHGTLGVHASVAYRNGYTQFNQAALTSEAVSQFGNAPGTTLAQQAAVVAATSGSQGSVIGMVQTISELRFQSVSINYQVPPRLSAWARIPRMSVALQGSNLGLHTNYSGFDPNVNAYSTSGSNGDQVADAGQLPQPRTWILRLTLGN